MELFELILRAARQKERTRLRDQAASLRNARQSADARRHPTSCILLNRILNVVLGEHVLLVNVLLAVSARARSRSHRVVREEQIINAEIRLGLSAHFGRLSHGQVEVVALFVVGRSQLLNEIVHFVEAHRVRVGVVEAQLVVVVVVVVVLFALFIVVLALISIAKQLVDFADTSVIVLVVVVVAV